MAGLRLLEYHSPLVTFKYGRGWVVDGRFNLVHTIHLEECQRLLDQTLALLNKTIVDDKEKLVIDYHVNTISSQLETLKGNHKKGKRSINWIGSA